MRSSKRLSIQESSAEPERQYLSIRVPAINLAALTSPKGLLLLILLSYLLSAFLYLKLRALENGESGGGITTVVPTTAANVTDALTDFAKTAKMDTKKFLTCLSSHKYAATISKDVADGETAAISATPAFIINGTTIVGAQSFTAFKTIIDQELTKQTPSKPKVAVSQGHLPLLGKASAPVTIIEFSDFQCPFCEEFFSSTFAQLKREYIDTGKVKLAFRQYPIPSLHPNAQIAAEASECAQEQGKFWQFHDMLFSNQQTWSPLPQSGTTSS